MRGHQFVSEHSYAVIECALKSAPRTESTVVFKMSSLNRVRVRKEMVPSHTKLEA